MTAGTSTPLSDFQVKARHLHRRGVEVSAAISDFIEQLRAFTLDLDQAEGPLHTRCGAETAFRSIDQELEESTSWVCKHMPDELLEASALVDLAERMGRING